MKEAAMLLLKNKNLNAKQALLACEFSLDVAASNAAQKRCNQIKRRLEDKSKKENANKRLQNHREKKKLLWSDVVTVADSSGVSDLTSNTCSNISNSLESNTNNSEKSKDKSNISTKMSSSTKISYKKMEAYLHPTLLDHKAAP